VTVALESLAGDGHDGLAEAVLDGRVVGIEEAVHAAALEAVGKPQPAGHLVAVRARAALVRRGDLDQRGDPLRPRKRERHRGVGAHRRAADRGPVGAEVVEHRAQVLDEVAVLVRRAVRGGGGLAVAAGVERGQPVTRAREPLGPHDGVVARRGQAVHQHHVGPFADGLARDRDAAGLELEGFGSG
jgi:hypothetical protein